MIFQGIFQLIIKAIHHHLRGIRSYTSNVTRETFEMTSKTGSINSRVARSEETDMIIKTGRKIISSSGKIKGTFEMKIKTGKIITIIITNKEMNISGKIIIKNGKEIINSVTTQETFEMIVKIGNTRTNRAVIGMKRCEKIETRNRIGSHRSKISSETNHEGFNRHNIEIRLRMGIEMTMEMPLEIQGPIGIIGKFQ